VGNEAVIQNSLIHNGCIIEGEVVNSILFPGVHVKPGAVVRNSVLFFNNVVGRNALVDKTISDVNVAIGARVRIGDEGPLDEKEVTVVGWNNHLPDGMLIGSGCTLYPALKPGEMVPVLKTGEVLR
jgi:glucose-1-phosphate adenylyltransferase